LLTREGLPGLILALLSESGMQGATAAWAVDLLTLYVTAIAAEQSSSQAHDTSIERLQQALAAVTPAEYPHIYGLRDQMFSGGGAERFERTVDVLLAGLAESHPAPS
jgi:hypothetical protein